MVDEMFVPLSYYLNTNLFNIVELPQGFLDKIGIVECLLEVTEKPAEGTEEQTFEETIFDEVEGEDITIEWTEEQVIQETKITFSIATSEELSFAIPGLDGIEFVMVSTESPGVSPFTAVLTMRDDGSFELGAGIVFKLRFDRGLLKPMARRAGEDGKSVFEEDKGIDKVEIEIGEVGLALDSEGNFDFGAGMNFGIDRPVMIGDTRVILDHLAGLSFNFGGNGSKPENAPDDWKGLYIGNAEVCIPALMDGSFTTTDLGIGSGGFYGNIGYDDTAIEGEIFGMQGSIASIHLQFVQSIPIEAEITGQVILPFFDEPVNVEIGISMDGGFTVKLDSNNGLYTLVKPNILELELESLGFQVEDGVFTAKLSGELTPLIAGLDWPSFQVKELSIDSQGNVHLEGGWLDLREQYSLDFYGFQFEITKLGFGKTDDGGKWIGFSGGIKLVDGFPAGASVEGLRVIWYEDREVRITLNGVGVEFEVENALRFQGAVSYRELENIHRFDGDIKLELTALDLEIDAKLVIGYDSDHGYTFLAIYLGVELPAGIPLWSTGLGLYGMAGLFALFMEPNKQPNEEWYGLGPGEGWFKRPEIGVTDLRNKWDPQEGALGLGAGVTIGTVADNGFVFSGKVLLVIVFPGPIILIEGKANLLKERAKLDEEPIFRALAVLDFRSGTFLVGLDAQYKYNEEGRLIDIRGGAEAYFSFSNPGAWHLYLGEKEPKERRIRASILSLFEANAYFMLDASQIATGAWIGWAAKWKFGPVGLTAEAWLEGNTIISWKPPFFHGDLWLHGKVELIVFWFEFGLSLDARFAVDVFDPFHILAQLCIGVNLPWPLPDFDIDLTLEWGPEPVWPPLPLPLKEIAIEHFKVTTSWPLPRVSDQPLLLPNYNLNNDGFRQDPDVDPNVIDLRPPYEIAAEENIPVVPLDCRPHITFGRPINDDAMVGVNVHPGDGVSECIGDPAKNEGPVNVRYGLQGIALHKWDRLTAEWHQVARKGSTGLPDDAEAVEELYGSWAPVPAMPDEGGEAVAQTKLWLWSKTPFDYTRYGGRSWDEWFTDRYTEYPCVPIPPDHWICYDFERVDLGLELDSPWAHPEETRLVFYWSGPDPIVTALETSVVCRNRALCFPTPPNTDITIYLPQPAKAVKVIAVDKEAFQVTAYNEVGTSVGSASGNPEEPEVLVEGEEITHVVVHGYIETCLVAVCIKIGLDDDEVMLREEMEEHLRVELARWLQEGDLLEPHTTYRLKVVTTLEAKGEGGLGSRNLEQVEYAYFRTEGPPGLTDLSVPIGHPNPEEFERNKGLSDLTSYVHQTVPPTVPALGQKLSLPRPVYRAYDAGVEFNENYVDLMYRLERRGLGLYLYDNNNWPMRDAQGRLIVLSNRWGVTETLLLVESDTRWITIINASTCAAINEEDIPRNRVLASSSEGQVLDPDTVYEARLIPLLLHEDFGTYSVGTSVRGPSGTLNRWVVQDEGTNNGASYWEIGERGIPPSRYIVQRSNIWGGTEDGKNPVKPGTMLLLADHPNLPAEHADQPGNWTNYRLNVYLRSADDDAIGVVFRYLDVNKYYRFSMDRQRKYRRLVRVVEGFHTILAEDDFVYQQNRDYLITVEAIDSSMRVYQDGMLVFDITDDSIDHGRIGLYCWANEGARFSDMRVDDFREQAPVVYRFKFTTSQFANFFHHLHSFQDEIWLDTLDTGIDTSVAVSLNETDSSPSDNEIRAYEALAKQVLGQATRQNPPEMQVTRVERDGEALAFLVQSPEPIDWKRTTLEVFFADHQVPHPQLPGTVKLTDVTFGKTQPNEESVTLLLREAEDLTGYRIESCHLPGPVAEPSGDPILFLDNFEREKGGLLFRETFGPNALDLYEIIDEGAYLRPSAWSISASHITQTSNIFGGSLSKNVPDKPGTMALIGSSSWSNVRISATLRSEDDDAIGIVFRYRDINNYYRFSMDRERSYRRLIKKVGNTVSVLWQDGASYDQGRPYKLVIYAFGDRFLGYLDNVLLFNVVDRDIAAGRVGFYCWANMGAHFEELSVEALETPPLLWQPTFEDFRKVVIADEGDHRGLFRWEANADELGHAGNIDGRGIAGSVPDKPGTFALGGNTNWRDVRISVRLRPDDDDAIGVMFRVTPILGPEGEEFGHNYYRFSMDRQRMCFHFAKKVGNTVTVLRQDAISYTKGQSHELTIDALGSELRGYLDGRLLFAVYDADLRNGKIGLYCRAKTGAIFERVVVVDLTRRVGQWVIHDEGMNSAPSIWYLHNGALLQTANIYGGSTSGTDPVKPGTYAVAGDPSWTDYRLIVKMRSDDDDAIGTIFRYIDHNNYYRLSLDSQRNYQQLIKKENGVEIVLWEKTGGYVVGDLFTLTVDVIGSHLVAYMGDVRLFALTDDLHASGRIGLYCWANDGARFEHVEVRRPSLEGYALLRDRFADSDISGWSFVNEGTKYAPSNWYTFEGALRQTSNIYEPPDDRNTLSKRGTQAIAGDPKWTDIIVSARLQSFDDDAIGLLFRYTDGDNYYRFSMDSQRGYRRVVKNVRGTFALLWEDDFSYEVGRIYEITIVAVGNTLHGYMDCEPIFVVEDIDQVSGQIGLYCWANQDARFSQIHVFPGNLVFNDWLLDEQFDVLIPDRWSFVDEGDKQGPSQWKVVAGELCQISNIYGGSTRRGDLDKPGTYALAGNAMWTDYRVSVRLRSDDNDTIGVMFRFTDEDNYYRFSMDRQLRYRRLTKKVDGAVAVLWDDDIQYILGREYILTIHCVGERLTGYLDGVRLFTVEDSDLTSGRIGLYSWRNRGAHFAEVRIAASVCIPYYIFSREARLPAGTRMRVYAGNLLNAPPGEPGIVQRFIASLDYPGSLHLSAEGVDLRLGVPGETGSHARRFLPDSDYTSIDMRLLRKADGTGFFILRPAGASLEAGQYRMRMTYRRDNQNHAPGSQVFMQEGNKEPEAVNIDIPWE